jgi:hypothetical protein
VAVVGHALDHHSQAHLREQRERGVAREVVRVVDLDGALDAAAPTEHEAHVEHVDEREATRCQHVAKRARDRGRIENMVDRLAEQDQVPGPPGGIEVLDEARHRLHPAGLRHRELRGRRIEDGGRKARERRAHTIGDHTRGTTQVDERSRFARQARAQEGCEVVAIFALLDLDGLGVDQPAVVGGHEGPVHVLVEVPVLTRGQAWREEPEPARRANEEWHPIAVAVLARHFDMTWRAAQVALADGLVGPGLVVVAERCDARGDGIRNGHRIAPPFLAKRTLPARFAPLIGTKHVR